MPKKNKIKMLIRFYTYYHAQRVLNAASKLSDNIREHIKI